MKYVHLRYRFVESITEQNQQGIDNLGGATICYNHDEHTKVVTYAFALCRCGYPASKGGDADNFSRSKGREHAEDAYERGDRYEYHYIGEYNPDAFFLRAKTKVWEKAQRKLDQAYGENQVNAEQALF